MKTVIRKLKFGVLLTGLIFLVSCNNNTAQISSLGINVVYRAIPAAATTVMRYTEIKISEYFNRKTVIKKGENISGKKVEKAGSNPKARPVTIGVVKEARLV